MHRSLILFLFTALLLPACSLVPTGPNAGQLLPRSDLGTTHHPAGFSMYYPTTWKRLDTGEYPMVWSFQVPPGTSLLEKRMEIDVLEHAVDCRQSIYGGGDPSASPEHVRVNNADFLLERGSGIAAGNIYEWTSYSAPRDSNCITITFVLHSASSGVYATEPPPFDRAAESAVFEQLISSFRFN